MSRGIEAGDVVVGKYHLDRVLHEGPMTRVLAGRVLQSGEAVALKTLLLHALENPMAAGRFTREMRASAQLKGEHNVRVIEVGTTESGLPFMVMELLEGSTLAALLAESGAMAVDAASTVALQLCDALAEAHAGGVVHRNLTPANTFLVRRGGVPLVKLLDFGLSKAGETEPENFNLTADGSMLGSAVYSAPEQIGSVHEADERSDLWSVGVILFEMLIGSPPFYSPHLPRLCAAILTHPTPQLSSQRPEIPVELEAVVHRCLEKDPSKRFPSSAALASALLPYATEQGRGSIGHAARMVSTAPARAAKSSTGLLMAAVAFGLLILAIVGYLVWGAMHAG